eukprot:gnl/Carplike_NY0171/5571_a7635_212.p1 GENE.gnl/Carplike_NY0171/5571_a7635_212~~gnl/Carplike_NY0171/5571_a7635_212.p1  ORF type:complete len:197 (-),score=26.80 gnl/Carplike_NY0171/5571_a7635_212:35-538(-)
MKEAMQTADATPVARSNICKGTQARAKYIEKCAKVLPSALISPSIDKRYRIKRYKEGHRYQKVKGFKKLIDKQIKHDKGHAELDIMDPIQRVRSKLTNKHSNKEMAVLFKAFESIDFADVKEDISKIEKKYLDKSTRSSGKPKSKSRKKVKETKEREENEMPNKDPT